MSDETLAALFDELQSVVADLKAIIPGICDALFAVILTLETAGMIERHEIVETLGVVRQSVLRREGVQTGRTLIADLLLSALAAPPAGAPRKGLRVIAGGAGNDPQPPPPEAA